MDKRFRFSSYEINPIFYPTFYAICHKKFLGQLFKLYNEMDIWPDYQCDIM